MKAEKQQHVLKHRRRRRLIKLHERTLTAALSVIIGITFWYSRRVLSFRLSLSLLPPFIAALFLSLRAVGVRTSSAGRRFFRSFESNLFNIVHRTFHAVGLECFLYFLPIGFHFAFCFVRFLFDRTRERREEVGLMIFSRIGRRGGTAAFCSKNVFSFVAETNHGRTCG